MTYFLGIDGGGTGCRARLVDVQGHVLGEGVAGPANISLAPQSAIANILTAAGCAAQQAGLSAEEIYPKTTACLGLAGANIEGAVAAVMPHLPFCSAQILSDAVTTVEGALEGSDAVVPAMGTGSVFAVRLGGQIRQIGGWGFLMGDEGSGAALGRSLLARALRAHDGLEVMTPLLAQSLAELGGAAGVVPFALSASTADFARFAPRLFETDDPAAAPILAEHADIIARSITLLQGGADLPVCWLGGLGAAWGAYFGDRWTRLMPKGSALDGATALARKAAQ